MANHHRVWQPLRVFANVTCISEAKQPLAKIASGFNLSQVVNDVCHVLVASCYVATYANASSEVKSN